MCLCILHWSGKEIILEIEGIKCKHVIAKSESVFVTTFPGVTNTDSSAESVLDVTCKALPRTEYQHVVEVWLSYTACLPV